MGPAPTGSNRFWPPKLAAQGSRPDRDAGLRRPGGGAPSAYEHPDLSAQAAPDGTITLLFSDIEGSTAIAERLGDDRWFKVLQEHNEMVREHVRAQGGLR